MLLTIDVSKLRNETLCEIAGLIDDPQALDALACIEIPDVLKEVVKNKYTTKETRGKIYASNSNSTEIVALLVKHPLDAATIHAMLEKIEKDDIYLLNLVYQEAISTEDLRKIFNKIVNGDREVSIRLEHDVLSAIAKNPNADEEMLQFLIDYSYETALCVLTHNRECIRIDLSRRQKQ